MGQPIFLCYAREDQSFVLSCAAQLKSRGFDVWLDQWAIPKGADWDRAVDEALSACACVLIVLSPDSVNSDEVRGELRTALEADKPIVPVLYRPCQVPRRLRLRQYVEAPGGDWAAPEAAERMAEALREALSAAGHAPKARVVDYRAGGADRSRPPEEGGPPADAIDWRRPFRWLGAVRGWFRDRPSYLLAFALPPLAFATWHLFRLPITVEDVYVIVFAAALAACAFAVWIGNHLSAVLLAVLIGAAFVVKPLAVPFDGFGPRSLGYDSETAMTYWVPGGVLVIVGGVWGIIAGRRRLAQDARRLRPKPGPVLVAAATCVAAGLYFVRPTLYDVYRQFRPQYAELRTQLKTVVAPAIDRLPGPKALSGNLETPLVLTDETGNRIRNPDPSTTAYFYQYPHLIEPDVPGDLDYVFHSNLHLNLRDTGPDPVLYWSIFTQFASDGDRRSLEQTLGATYLVVIKKATPRRAERDSATPSGPYQVFLYHLKRNEVCFADEVNPASASTEELKQVVYKMLERSLGARIVQ